MNLQHLLSNLTPQQVNEILVGDGIEGKGCISDIKSEGDCLYSYESFNPITKQFKKKMVKVILDKNRCFFTIEYLKITRH